MFFMVERLLKIIIEHKQVSRLCFRRYYGMIFFRRISIFGGVTSLAERRGVAGGKEIEHLF